MKRKIISLLLSIMTAVTFASCDILPSYEDTFEESSSSVEEKKFDRSKDYAKYREELELHASNVIAAFMDHDKESLANEFCEKTREICDLSTEIDAVFEWLDSEILSYGEIKTEFKAEAFGGGYVTQLTGISDIYDVKTESESYTISLNCVLIYDDDKTEVGLQQIGIYTSDWHASDNDKSKRMEIGEFLDSWNL